MSIFAVALNIHDHNTYNGDVHIQIERQNRKRHNLNPANPHDAFPSQKFFKEHVLEAFKNRTQDNVFAFTVSNLGQEYVSDLLDQHFPNKNFLDFKPLTLWEHYHKDEMYYIDHHQSHSAYAFLTSGYDHSDILAIDGRGWKFNCIFINRYGFITDFSKQIPIGGLWNRLAQDLGFRYLDAGKVMGLAGYGKYNYQAHAMIEAYVLNANHKLPDFADEVIKKVSREDIAHTLQQVTIDLIKKYIYPLKTCDNICLAGGVAYNGYMNEELTKHYDNVHVPPAVGDEGQALGTYMHADYVLNQNVHTPTVFAGPDQKVYETMMLDFKAVQYSNDDLNKEVATAISKGSIVGWYQGRSESGNRALGNRSILADPRNPNIKDIINKTIKKREDFRPFAPSVLEEHYKEYFDTNQPSPYMSRIMPVKSDKIPGVTHVDNTARIQTVNKEFNYKFYKLIEEFYNITGIPMLLNTSFNCQEPMVETPEDAINTFNNTDLDMVVINDWIIRKD